MIIQDFKLINGSSSLKATFVVARGDHNDPENMEYMLCSYFQDSVRDRRWIGYPSSSFKNREGETKYKKQYWLGKKRQQKIEAEIWPLLEVELAKQSIPQKSQSYTPTQPYFDDSSCPF